MSVTQGGSYRPVAGDFDGDGHDDIVWYQPGLGADEVWYGSATRNSLDRGGPDPRQRRVAAVIGVIVTIAIRVLVVAAIIAGAAYLIDKGVEVVGGLLNEDAEAGDALGECVTGDQGGALAGAAGEAVEAAAGEANPDLSLDKKNDRWIEGQTGVSAHEIKREIVGSSRGSRYDLYVDRTPATSTSWARVGKGEPQQTGYNVR